MPLPPGIRWSQTMTLKFFFRKANSASRADFAVVTSKLAPSTYVNTSNIGASSSTTRMGSRTATDWAGGESGELMSVGTTMPPPPANAILKPPFYIFFGEP